MPLRVVLVPARGDLRELDYVLPDGIGPIEAGTRVLVPIGSRRSMGIVLDPEVESSHARLKPIIAVLDTKPIFDRTLLDLLRWMADYYLHPLGEAVETALPGVLRMETEMWAEWVADNGGVPVAERKLIEFLRDAGAQPVSALVQRFGRPARRTIERLARTGSVRLVEKLRRETVPTRHRNIYEAINSNEASARLARRPALMHLYNYLRDHPLGRAAIAELRASFPSALAKLQVLAEAGLVRVRTEEVYHSVLPPVATPDRKVNLSQAQRRAVDEICACMDESPQRRFGPFLLWGVTGSGKTEVYLHAIAAALERGRTALVLVPEISLTHQLVDRVRARFGDRVAVLHSQLGTGERWDEWRRIARGEAPIVIGARSAIFAPLRDIGVIIVDEEHDAAYKQTDGLHYNGRDVAVMRAKLTGCPVVLGSATPSMESFHNARSGRYRLLELRERVKSRPLPEVELIDLRGDRPSGMVPLSAKLIAAVEANFVTGGQTLLFLNRRGFANFLQCHACGEPVMCPNCSVTLTWHQRWHALKCHYCDHTRRRPEACSECGEPALHVWGMGTEQLEVLLKQRFPAARIARMDRDTTQRKGSQAALLEAWSKGRIDILIGTQMIAKGHDIPGVTLVGVVLADQSLNFPDFRAAERTFQMLAQVAGRAGRGDRPGRVIVQTLQPMHYSLRAAADHDFLEFAEQEMAARTELEYPPVGRLVLVRFESENLAALEKLAREAAAALRERGQRRFGVLGPAPAPLERLRGRHRWQILLRSSTGRPAREAVRDIVLPLRNTARRKSVRIVVDVDPQGTL